MRGTILFICFALLMAGVYSESQGYSWYWLGYNSDPTLPYNYECVPDPSDPFCYGAMTPGQFIDPTLDYARFYSCGPGTSNMSIAAGSSLSWPRMFVVGCLTITLNTGSAFTIYSPYLNTWSLTSIVAIGPLGTSTVTLGDVAQLKPFTPASFDASGLNGALTLQFMGVQLTNMVSSASQLIFNGVQTSVAFNGVTYNDNPATSTSFSFGASSNKIEPKVIFNSFVKTGPTVISLGLANKNSFFQTSVQGTLNINSGTLALNDLQTATSHYISGSVTLAGAGALTLVGPWSLNVGGSITGGTNGNTVNWTPALRSSSSQVLTLAGSVTQVNLLVNVAGLNPVIYTTGTYNDVQLTVQGNNLVLDRQGQPGDASFTSITASSLTIRNGNFTVLTAYTGTLTSINANLILVGN